MKRLQYIEFLRVIATLGVLCNHIPLAADHIFKNTASLFDDVFTNSIVSVVHWAVPVFVMITGALLLNPTREVTFGKAIKKYCWRMVVILLTVGWTFALMEQFSVTHIIDLNLFTTSFYNVLIGKSWKHLWYLYMLIGLYLVIPFIKPAIKYLSIRSVDCMLIILFLFTSILPAVSFFFHFSFGVKFPIPSCYVMYLILGWRLSQLSADTWFIKHKKLIAAIAVLLSLFLIGCCWMEYTRQLKIFNYWSRYDSPVEVVLGAIVFILALTYNDKLGRFVQLKSMQLISRNSFGIYVFHMLWVNIIYKVIKYNPLAYNPSVFLALLAIVLILSIITTEVFRKIPWLGKFI